MTYPIIGGPGVITYSEHIEYVNHILVTKDDRIIVKTKVQTLPSRVPSRKKFLRVGNVVYNK